MTDTLALLRQVGRVALDHRRGQAVARALDAVRLHSAAGCITAADFLATVHGLGRYVHRSRHWLTHPERREPGSGPRAARKSSR